MCYTIIQYYIYSTFSTISLFAFNNSRSTVANLVAMEDTRSASFGVRLISLAIAFVIGLDGFVKVLPACAFPGKGVL